MLRYLSAPALLLWLPVGVFAQHGPPGGVTAPGIAASPSGIGAGIRIAAPFSPTSPIPMPPRYHNGGGLGGGFVPTIPAFSNPPGFPFSGVWGAYGFGGAYPGYGYGFGYAPSANFAFGSPNYESAPIPVTTAPNIALVNEFPAVLTMEFPAPAEVWVNGKKGEGKATTEWTLTSPSLKAGTEFTFEVKARWTVDGKTYEYERKVNVASGNRSRALVIAGSEVKE